MAETQTPNYKWVKPDLGGDSAIWGNVQNSTIDAIDGVVWANQQAGAPIGTIVMFGGASLPTNWLWCNGAVYLDTDIPSLAPILNKKYTGSDATHTALPYIWGGTFPLATDFSGWAMGLRGGEANHVLTVNEMPAHAHTVWQAGHSHYVYQDAHNHSASQDAHAHTVANGTHSHNIVTGNHSHGIATGGHAHNYTQATNFAGYTGQYPSTASVGQTTGTTSSAGNLGGNTDTAGNLGGYADAQYANIGNTDTRQPGVYTGNATPAIHVDTQTPAVAMSNAGGGAAANNMPPYTVVAFIIRFK